MKNVERFHVKWGIFLKKMFPVQLWALEVQCKFQKALVLGANVSSFHKSVKHSVSILEKLINAACKPSQYYISGFITNCGKLKRKLSPTQYSSSINFSFVLAAPLYPLKFFYSFFLCPSFSNLICWLGSKIWNWTL